MSSGSKCGVFTWCADFDVTLHLLTKVVLSRRGVLEMFNVCPSCGIYSEEKSIDPQGPFAICPHCGYGHRFVQLPLFVITGASGTGKSTVCLDLVAEVPECVCLECDIFWRPEFATPEDNYRGFRNLCLRVAKNIGQSGRPVVLTGSAIPEQYEVCPERMYFAETHYLAMVCEDETLVKRLQDRPGWRKSAEPETLRRMVEFNRWFFENAHNTKPPMTLLDTTGFSIEQSVERVAGWIRSRLPQA
jgi:predicted kinase